MHTKNPSGNGEKIPHNGKWQDNANKGRQGHFRRRKSKRAKHQYKWMKEVKGSSYKRRIKKLAPYLKR